VGGIFRIEAIREIEPGEEITLDYASFQFDALDGSSFNCACGAQSCRRKVTPSDWRQIETARDPKYKRLLPFLQAQVDPQGSERARDFKSMIFPDGWWLPECESGELCSTLISNKVEFASDLGAVAKRPLKPGEVVFVAGGRVVHPSAEGTVIDNNRFGFREIEGGFFMGPSHAWDRQVLDKFVLVPSKMEDNNSANLRRVFGAFFVAIRHIGPGEKLSVVNMDCHPSARENFTSLSPVPDRFWYEQQNAHSGPCAETLGGSFPVNTDADPRNSAARANGLLDVVQGLRHLAVSIWNFTTHFTISSIKDDWSAAPIAFASSMLGSYVTAMTVDALGPFIGGALGGAHSPSFVLATSVAAVVLGYSSYIILYGAGMLWKERSNLFDTDGKLCSEGCRKTWRVFKIDFFMHLPSDIWWAVGIFSAQAGLYVTGASSLFWSIIATQALSDVYYSLREPFYWQASKMLANRFDRNAAALVPANEGDFPDGEHDRAIVNG
jgi:hypothetical protein